MSGVIASESQLTQILGLSHGCIERMIAEGMPALGGNGDGDESATPAIDPQACTKRDVARYLGVKLADVDKWVRLGCPHESTGKVRAPLLFNMPQVFRWHYIYNCALNGGGKLAEKEVEIWNLELALEVGTAEASRLLGLRSGGSIRPSKS